MDENSPPRLSRKLGTTSSSSSDHHGETSSAVAGAGAGPTTTTRKSRYPDDEVGDRIECSGKYCQSCSGALVADCVALCCCPCALLNFLTLAFVKVPWMVGRKCLGLGKKKGRKKKNKRECKKASSESIDYHHRHHQGSHQYLCGMERVEEERMPEEISGYGFGEEEQMECVSARLEAERVWLELYQIGHLGFGRVSFTGIQSLGKGN